ncbi:2'-5' RNA ligase family protein [Phenylobacterium soli]|uniref:2'-5' RNA ligase family protein n=1 Tax=Phenylobacterium soli TaxID=2170551 RepID=A0A328AEP3_9CAUL|nr:2'-5' RNA ligase family protein [Phenylobacterium soli]
MLLVPELAPLIDDMRARHDPAFRQGMPAHLTVLYPFMDPVTIGPTQRGKVAEVFRGFEAFELSFSRIGRFPEALWLAPDPAEAVTAMVEAMVAAFPAYPPYRGQFDTIIPHVTVAQGEGLEMGALEPELRRRFATPVRVKVEAVALFTTVRRRWREVDRFLLASP